MRQKNNPQRNQKTIRTTKINHKDGVRESSFETVSYVSSSSSLDIPSYWYIYKTSFSTFRTLPRDEEAPTLWGLNILTRPSHTSFIVVGVTIISCKPLASWISAFKKWLFICLSKEDSSTLGTLGREMSHKCFPTNNS